MDYARPAIYLVGGPSGAGKDTLLLSARSACRDEPVTFVRRRVTRAPRNCTELEDSMDAEVFRAAEAAGEHALSWSAHESVRYAIPRAALEAALEAVPPQRIVLNVSRSICDAVLRDYSPRADVYVLLISASPETLRARLRSRGREDDAAVEARVAKATAYELPHAALGHRVLRVLNDASVEAATAKVRTALLHPAAVTVVGLVGCSAAGKSTLCAALARLLLGGRTWRRRLSSPSARALLAPLLAPSGEGAAAVPLAAAATAAAACVAAAALARVATTPGSPRGFPLLVAAAAATSAAVGIAMAAACAARDGGGGGGESGGSGGSGGASGHGRFDRLTVVTCDDFYLPLARCPRFELAGDIAWPGGAGAVPSAFAARGDADLNHPAAVDWAGVAAALDAAIDAAAAADAADGGKTLVVLEGLLLLGAGAEAVRRRVGSWVLLDDQPHDAAAQEVLWRRKWQRSGHLGKPSYRERGVSEGAYAAYWRDYVAKRWREHGLERTGALAAESGGRAPALTTLSCFEPPDGLAAAMLRAVKGGSD